MPYTIDELQLPAIFRLPERAEFLEKLHPTRALSPLSARSFISLVIGVSLTFIAK